MKKIFIMSFLFLAATVFALPAADELSTKELVGQTIMPRVVIGKHKVFKKPVQKGEVSGFFIKAHEGQLIHPVITLENQDKFTKRQRKKLLKTLKDLSKWADKNPRKIPLFLAFDYEGGTVTSPMFMGLKQMPSNMLLAATRNAGLVEKMYAEQAAEIKLAGGNMALGPDTDVNSNPANPIIQTRSFGDNAQAVGKFSAAAVRGLQTNGVAAVIKHFPGHGDTATDSHFSQPITNMPENDLWKTHISAFQIPINAGASGVMTNHVLYPFVDKENTAIFSSKITKDILRRRMGFNGIVLTDGLDMDGTGNKSVQEIVLEGLSAGNDILLLTGKPAEIEASAYYPKMAARFVEEDLQQEKPVFSRADLIGSVQRILDIKQHLPSNVVKGESNFDTIARQVAEEGVTLLRDNQHFVQSFKTVQNVCVVMFADGIFSKQVHQMAEVLEQNGKTVSYLQLPRAAADGAGINIKKCLDDTQAVIAGTSTTSAINPNQYELVNQLLQQAQEQGKPAALISLLNPYEIPSYPQAQTLLALYGATADAVNVAGEILLGLRQARGTLPINLPKTAKMPFEKVNRLNFL